MKTLRYKGTPPFGSAIFYSASVSDDTILASIIHPLKGWPYGIVYTDVDDLTYFAIRAARLWLLSEPGDVAADKQFHVELVKAGLVPDTRDILGVVCTGEDDYRVQVVTEATIFTLDTNAATVTSVPMPQEVAA